MIYNKLSELLHAFANQKQDGRLKGQKYYFTGNVLCYDGSIIAVADFKNGHVFYSDYNRGWDGYKSYKLINSFTNDYVCFFIDKWFLPSSEINKLQELAWLELFENHQNYIGSLLYCSRGRGYFYSSGLLTRHKPLLLQYRNWATDKTISRVSYKHYTGWGSYKYRLFDIPTCTLLEFVEMSFEEDIKIADFKSWCYRYSKYLPKSKKEREAIYNDPDKKHSFLKRVIDIQERQRKQKEEEENRKNEEFLKKWENHETYKILYRPHKIRLRLKLNKVETSKGASVNVKSAILLFKAWEQFIENGNSTFIGRSVDGFRVNRFTGDGIEIGCHWLSRDIFVPFYEKFLKDYKFTDTNESKF